MTPTQRAEPNEKHKTLPTDIHDEDRSTEGGPPGWIAFSIIAGVFVLGVFALLLIFGVLR